MQLWWSSQCVRIGRPIVRRSVQAISMSTHSPDPIDLALAKREQRVRIMAQLRVLTESHMREEGKKVESHLLRANVFKNARTAAIFVDCPRLREVRTRELITTFLSARKRIYVPRVLDRDSNMHFLELHALDDLVEVPPFGILEPLLTRHDGTPRPDVLSSGEPLDLVVMPGIAFDKDGQRLGRGGGYYDKFIESIVQVRDEAEEKHALQTAAPLI